MTLSDPEVLLTVAVCPLGPSAIEADELVRLPPLFVNVTDGSESPSVMEETEGFARTGGLELAVCTFAKARAVAVWLSVSVAVSAIWMSLPSVSPAVATVMVAPLSVVLLMDAPEPVCVMADV